MIGKTLSHYRIVEKIGAGGMGEVYRARDERLGRDVALKVLPAGTLGDEHARKRFRKEAQALSKLSHPNIATVFDFDTEDGTDFLAMELVEGVTLSDKLAAGALSEKEITRLGMQLAEALEEAHERGVVHRDLKPGNVMVTAKGQAKVLDFGLAKLVRPDVASATAPTESFTETQAAAGTLPYMAPEQLRGETVDARTDIHALGAVLYEMATGQRPFQERLATALVDDIMHKPPPLPGRLKPDLSPRLEELILKCLEKEPERRYQSAKEIAVDLRRLGVPSTAVRAEARPGPQRKAVWVVGLTVVALAAVLVGLNVGKLRERLLGGAAPGQITSLAVLPLENLMGDSEQDYFVDGMHDELIANLAKIGALTVISRTSAMRCKGTDKSLPEIARELGVDAVIEGTVRRAGNQVRITVQLIEAATDKHLFAESYQRELRNILALQSEVAQAIAREIKVAVTPEEEARLARARTVNPEAYEAYLKGRYQLSKWTEDSTKKGMEYFRRAIEIDPGYAPAYAGLADAYYGLSNLYLPPREAMPKARAAALKALEIDERLAEAHTSLAMVKAFYDWDWEGAEREFKRALELNPGYADAHLWYGCHLVGVGRSEEALAQAKQAQDLDPLSPGINGYGGLVFYLAGQYDQAIERARKAIEMEPTPIAHWVLGLAFEQKGMYKEAVAEYRKAVSLGGGPQGQAVLGHGSAVSGQTSEARKILAQLMALSKRTFVSGYGIATIYAGMGEKDQAFGWLEKAYEQRAENLVWLKIDPRFESLRDDHRFQSLLRRLNFPE